MRKALPFLVIVLGLPALAGGPQTPPPAAVEQKKAAEPNPFMAYTRTMFAGVKSILLATAEKMPEADYGFKPADSVRTFGQIIGHVADSNYYFASMVLGEKSPSPQVEKTKTTKAELIAALKEAFAYADRAYDGLTDATAAQTVKMWGEDTPKLGVLSVNNIHTIEHYGNLVTYLRMKGIVPPTSEPGFRPGK